MYTFDEIKEHLKNSSQRKQKVIAVAAAGDKVVLETIKTINELGIGRGILIGDAKKIKAYAEETGCDLAENSIVDEKDERRAATLAVLRVRDDEADILMKGLLQTKTYLQAVLNKEYGLRTGKLLNAVTAFEPPALERMFLATDCGMIVTPSLKDKVEMIGNAVTLAKALKCEMPRVSCVGAVETVNDNMPDGIDAAILSKMNDRGQIKGCIVDGPLSLDLSLSQRSVAHKGVKSPVAGQADILLMPNLQAGNIFWKTMTYMGGSQSGAVIMGASRPVVLTSRADTAQAKVNSIALALMLSEHQKA
ncbi:MAG: bifunctional enoyl-CoA hydratase/phosphate acetyltransferase [Eubacterium sp.]|nr:bifunctional enoyl-CoA hydratase/phosphate acetyltransferase [Eubacterium sp.]